MKKIVITGYSEYGDIPEKKSLVVIGGESMDAQDGYHTFTELYDHRIALFIALCKNMYDILAIESPGKYLVWKAKIHSDGSAYDGWFIMGIGTEKGKQISYHLPLKEWETTEFAEILDKAPEWDGHTPADVIARLKLL